MVIPTPTSVIFRDIKKHYKDYYAEKVKRPCDEDCSEGCCGDHNYELPESYPKLFNSKDS